MFKGYIPTKGKKPTEEYKNRTEFYNISDVENLNSYGAVLKDNIIQIDIDDKEQSDIVFKIVKEQNIKCNVVETSRGKHFYFLNKNIDRRKQGYWVAIGVKVDIGLGSQNAVIPIKIDGKARNWLQQFDKIDYLPAWLAPLDKNSVDFLDMKEGDGRNQSLYNYILRLQSADFSKEEIKDTIKIINKYILKEPLSDDEIDTILRDEAFLKESFYIDKKLQYEKLTKYLIDNENIVKVNNQLNIYKDGYYSDDLLHIEKVMLKYIKNSTKAPRAEILKYLELLCDNKELADTKYIVLKNGVFDLESKELLEHSPKYIIKNKIMYDYNPYAYHELLDKTLNKICVNDKSLRLVLEEMIGYTLLRRSEIGKSFILTGNGSNGKSTLLHLINELLGEENISAMALKELSDRFKTYQLEGKLANIGDDISNEYIQDNSTFKKLVTGDKVNVERKGIDPYDFKNYSKLIFSANELPRINDLSNGLKRRLVFIPFNAVFSKNDEDYEPFIKDKLTSKESMEYLLKVSIDGLYRLLDNRAITNCKACNEIWGEYEEINNPVTLFTKEYKIENESVNNIYRQYQVWCMESGLRSLSKIMFGKEVRKQGFSNHKIIRINGHVSKIYTIN